MYRIEDAKKQDAERRWALPDRVFFACGACHILAYAFIEANPSAPLRAIWLKPVKGFKGNHIFVTAEDFVFDYHGYSKPEDYDRHTWSKARRWWPGWDAEKVELPMGVLISEARSRGYEGLWLRQPDQYLRNALPRARAFLNRFPPPVAGLKTLGASAPGFR